MMQYSTLCVTLLQGPPLMGCWAYLFDAAQLQRLFCMLLLLQCGLSNNDVTWVCLKCNKTKWRLTWGRSKDNETREDREQVITSWSDRGFALPFYLKHCVDHKVESVCVCEWKCLCVYAVVKGYGLYKQGRDLCISSFLPLFHLIDFYLAASALDGTRLRVCAPVFDL